MRRPALKVGLILALGVALLALRIHRRRRLPRETASVVQTFPAHSPATVLHVVDGDTAYFTLPDGGRVKARLAGVNTPECHKQQIRLPGGGRSARCIRDDELYGLAAYRELVRLLSRGPLELNCERKRDGRCRRGRYGRVLVTIRAAGADVAEQLVRAGAGWAYTKYPAANAAALCRAEETARRQKAGMWRQGDVEQVLARMSPRTRAWLETHDARCAAAR